MISLGMIRPGSTITIPFDSFAATTGAPTTISGFAVGDIRIYKSGSTTERASTTGYSLLDSDGIDFDGLTGINGFSIDLSSNADAGFFTAGASYFVVVSTITVDTQTVSFVAATFDIGYPDAQLNTTIATLASQTSFTLTTGPAEDDALNGRWAVIHDIASAVQVTWVQILDYTGSTKTVTLAATPATTFTVAAGDNFSLMGVVPLQPTVIGRFLDVSATGEAGVDWANVGSPTTTNALTNTTIATTQKVDLETIKLNAVTAPGSVVFPTGSTLASTTNISAGTLTTVTNLTNAPTVGDFTSTMKTSITTAATAATPTVSSISGNVGGNVVGSVGSVLGNVGGNVTGSVGSVTGLTVANLDTTVSSRLAKGTTLAEGYAAVGVSPTVEQMLFMILQNLAAFAITGATISVKKLDGTQAMSFTLDSSTAPTSRTRAT